LLDSFVVCDLETTGLDPATDEIIEVGLVRVVGGTLDDTYHTLVRPSFSVPQRVQALTGLSDADLARQPAWFEVKDEVQAFIAGDVLVGQHVGFDTAFLRRSGVRVREPALDTYELARLVLPCLASYRLESLCRHLDIDYPVRHRALEDALAAAKVFLALQDRLTKFDFVLLAQLQTILERGMSPWEKIVKDALHTSARSFAAAPKAAAAEETVWDEDCRPVPEGRQPVPDPLAVLAPGGALERVFPGYECREGQQKMAEAVFNALQSARHLVVEAGTGTGKSLAYLLPAAAWALTKGQRVLISTHTVTLQEQLIAKDVPLVSNVLGQPLSAAILKGRSHYLCRRRLHFVQAEGSNPEKALFLARVNVWLKETGSGDRSELSLTPGERNFWPEIAADHEGCAGAACRWYGSCFAMRARRKADRAQIVITNHALLLANLQVDDQMLPDYGPVIIDEAHHLEGVATEQFGRAVTRQELTTWLETLDRCIARVAEAYPGLAAAAFSAAQFALRNAVEDLCSFFIERLGDSDEPLVIQQGSELQGLVLDLNSAFQSMFSAADSVLDELSGGRNGPEGEAFEQMAPLLARGRRLADDLLFILGQAQEGLVAWAERAFRDGGVTFRAAPVEVDRLLYEGLYKVKAPVIFTSATITVDGSFDYFAERVGLHLFPADAVGKVRVASPFDYDRQALLAVTTDLPDPALTGQGQYLKALCGALERIVATAGGGTLVLFTSHKVLREAYRRLKERLQAYDIDLLGHHLDGGRTRLLEAFQSGERTVLFGAASFWEGIDVPGEALRCLVIVKLPFQPPNHPVAAARRQTLVERGKNAFSHLFLPQAVIRLKQGFGRLIRSSRDRGIVVVLDPRILEKQYGARFLRSLPVSGCEKGSLDEICARMAEWLRLQS